MLYQNYIRYIYIFWAILAEGEMKACGQFTIQCSCDVIILEMILFINEVRTILVLLEVHVYA